MRIVYVAGYGHSGSTLLGIIFGNADGTLNVGEATKLLLRPDTLAIGVPSNAANRGLSSAARDLISRYDSASISAAERLLPGGDPQLHARFWSECWRLFEDHTGCHTIIDSSKTAHGAIRRPSLLHEQGHEVRVVHVVRDPRAVLYSLYKKSKGRRFPFVGLIPLVGWILSNVLTWAMYRGITSTVVSYERLVSQPERELAHIESRIGLPLSSIAKDLVEGAPLDPGFQIDGNRMSRQGPITLRPDLAWQAHAPLRIRIVGALGLPVYRFVLSREARRGSTSP